MGKLIVAAIVSGGSKLLRFLGFVVVSAPVGLVVKEKLEESVSAILQLDSIALAFMTSAGIFEAVGIISSAILTVSAFNFSKIVKG